MTVGGGKREPTALNVDEHACQHRSRFVGGSRHLGLLDSFHQVVEGNLDLVALVRSRPWRKFLGFDALDVRVKARAPQVERLGGSVETSAGTNFLMPISRLVAVNARPSEVVSTRMLLRIGSVVRLEIARETTCSA